ncbi:MAG: hypothetical protein ACRDHN_12740 [Thermomicrobiales bacterium]
MMRRHRRWWFKHIAFSMVLGVLVSGALVLDWERGYADSSITVLGSGNGLSTLIQIETSRILIVSGDDPSEFANALAKARPGQTPRVDLVIVAPGATRVASRAIEIVKPAQVLVIESPLFEIAPNDWEAASSPVSVVSTIDIKDTAILEIDPGYSINTTSAGWSVRIRTTNGNILVSERAPLAALPEIDAFVISGDDSGPLIPTETSRFASSTLELPENSGIRKISPGETSQIKFES